MQVLPRSWRGVGAATAALSALLIPAVTPAHGNPTPPTDFTYDSSANQLVGLYSDPTIANSSDYVTGSVSKPTVPNIEVLVIFTGSGWGTTANAALQNTLTGYLRQAFTGPYFQELHQYGFQNATVGFLSDRSSTALSGSFTDTTLEAYVNTLLELKFASPSGYRIMYVVIPTPGSKNVGPGVPPTAGGEHFQYIAPGGVATLAAWVLPQGIMPGNVIHEVAETITDPIVGQNWQMDRGFGGPGNKEIADAGEGIYDWMPNYLQNASPYWSQLQRSCVIPVGTPQQAAGNSMTSYFDGTSTHVFYVSTDNNVHELIGTGNPPTWTAGNPPAYPTISALRGGTGLTSFWDPVAQIGHVYYVGQDGDIKEIYHLNTGTWGWNDLQVASNPNEPSDEHAFWVHKEIDGDRSLTSFYNPSEGSENVFFINEEPLIGAFKWTPTTGWENAYPPQFLDPKTNMVIDPEIGTQMSGLYDGSDHLFFIDSNDHIREYATADGTTWTTTDWSAAIGSGVALPGNDAIMSSADAGPTDNVCYIDTNNHIQLITRWDDGTFSNVDLTQTGVPAGSLPGSPTLSGMLDPSGSLHVYYIGQDSKVHEIKRFEINTYYETQLWEGMNTPQTPASRPYAMPSRLLTSCFDPYADNAQVFYLSNMFAPEGSYYSPVGCSYNLNFYTSNIYTGILPSTIARAPVGTP